MARTNRPTRPVLSAFLSNLGKIVILVASFQAVANADPIDITLLPSTTKTRAVVSPDKKLIVSVDTGSARLTGASWVNAGKTAKLILIGQDRVTRLCFFKNPGSNAGKQWKKSFLSEIPEELTAVSPNGRITCRFDKWVSQVGAKVLPLALLQISFKDKLPTAGTPLVDRNDQIVGLVLQPASANAVYAIPTQAIHRVQHDIADHRKLVRGWLGISLSTSSTIPRITRVWPGSPADKADLRENDILIKAGPYLTDRYPEAVNALFYTVPGQTTSIEILRDNKKIPCEIVPISQKPGE